MEESTLSNCGAGGLESPLDCKEIQPVHPKGNQPWILIGRTDAETEAPIIWPPDAKSQLIGKDSAAGKDWGQEKKGLTEDETVGWHHQLNGHEFEQTLGNSEGPGSLACYSPWGHKELDQLGGWTTTIYFTYMVIHVSVHSLNPSHPLLSPAASTSLLSMSAFLLLPYK